MKDLLRIFETHCQQSAISLASVWIHDDGNQNDDERTYLRLTYASAQLALEEHKASVHQYLSETRASVVAYLSSNVIDFFLSVVACSDPSTSATPALLNTRWTVSEMVAALKSSDFDDTTLLLYSSEMESIAVQIPLRMNHKVICKPIPQHSAKRIEKSPLPLPAKAMTRTNPNPRTDDIGLSQDDAVVVFTSGTSGKAKGVRLGHRAILLQALAKCQDPCGYDQDTRLLATTVPFYHVGGLSSILAVWLARGALVFPTTMQSKGNASFDPAQVLDSLSAPASIAANTLVVVPAMLHSLQIKLEETCQSATTTANYPHVRLLLVGGQSASKRNLDFIGRAFPNAKTVQTFACTEAASSLTFFNVKEKQSMAEALPHDLSADCVGYPSAHVHLYIMRDSQSQPLRIPYQIGSIAFRGPCRMSGYWNRRKEDPKDNQSNINEQQPQQLQWFVTNDLGFWDPQGRLYFVGRSTDSIRTGGETVFAAEVERVIIQHACVEECAVFPLKDDRFGETVCCAIVCNAKRPSLQEVREFCAKKGLAGYKRPNRLFVVNELPKNSSGKVLKFRIADLCRHEPAVRSKL